MVGAGLGAAILPAAEFEPCAEAMALAVRPPGERWAARSPALCIRGASGALSVAARLLVAYLLGRSFP